MRLVAVAFSAVLLSGCSWMGFGGNSSSNHGFSAGLNCYGGGYEYTQVATGYSQAGQAGCAGAGGYAVAGNGYGAQGYGAQGYGSQGFGLGGAYGANGAGIGVGMGVLGLRGAQGASATQYGYGQAGYNMQQGAGTVLGAGANYGSAVGGAQYVQGGAVGGQWVNGQWVAANTQVTGQSVQTVQGAPIYVPQPYPAYYGAPANGCMTGYNCGVGATSTALPFGIEAGIGTELGIGGDVFPSAIAKPAGTNNISAIDSIGYKDAYKNAIHYNLAATYDLDPSTTLIGQIGYSKAKGERLQIGTIDDGAAVSEELYAQWGDLEQITLEGGVRKYMGGWNKLHSGIRPYVGASAGFTHNTAVDLVQDSATLAPAALNTQHYIDSGWTPTASGIIGAEMQVGPRTAIGVESGIRWRDDLDTNLETNDRWSVPLKLRGRVSF